MEKKITAFFLDNGRMPTYSEIAEIIGVRSKSVVHFWVAKLLDAGIVQKDAKGFLTLTRNPRALKLAGEVCAGIPTSAEEDLRGIVSFDEYLVRHPETSFLLSVTGDSMIDAGIWEKDLVVVDTIAGSGAGGGNISGVLPKHGSAEPEVSPDQPAGRLLRRSDGVRPRPAPAAGIGFGESGRRASL